MIVNGCKLIAVAGSYIDDDPITLKQYKEFCNNLKAKPIDTVWYDLEDKKCFSLDLNYENSSPQETPLLASEDKFFINPRHGIAYFNFLKNLGLDLLELEYAKEIIIENSDKLSSIEGSSILIVGAGPSSKNIDFCKEEHDQLWVCNDFYKNEKHKNIKADIFYMSSAVQEKQESFNRMNKENNLITFFDINANRNVNTIKKYRESFKDRLILYSSRLFTTVGTVPRLINLACALGVKKISFAGMDGHSKEHFEKGESFSSFESDWKTIPSEQCFGSQRREYLLFWEYIRKRYPNIKFVNYGDSYEHNVSKNILGKFFK